MKKFLLFLQSLLICGVFFGCSADSEDNVMSDIQKVENAKLKIMEMANDYGLNIVMSDGLSGDIINNVDFKELEDLFKSLSSLNSVKRFSTERKGLEYRTVNEMVIPRRGLARSYESYSNYSTNFPDSTGQNLTVISTDRYYWECSCNVTWKSDGKFDVCCVDLIPNVELLPSVAEYTGIITDYEYEWRECGNASFTFDGEVSLAIMTSRGIVFFETIIGFNGIASNNGGHISWYNKSFD